MAAPSPIDPLTRTQQRVIIETQQLRQALLQANVTVDSENYLGGTCMQLNVRATADDDGQPKRRLVLHVSAGEYAKSYTVRESNHGFNLEKIIPRIVQRVAEEQEQTAWQRRNEAAAEQAARDATQINTELGIEDWQFPKVMANHNNVPLTISAPDGLTADQARAAMRAIIEHAPSADVE